MLAVRVRLEQRCPFPEEDRDEAQPVFVDEIVADERGRQVGAPEQEQIPQGFTPSKQPSKVTRFHITSLAMLLPEKAVPWNAS
jgi:hypothetical protein